MAYALNNIHAANMHGWRWMYVPDSPTQLMPRYLVEGLISACIVPVIWFVLPNNPSELRWLSPAEKEMFAKRAILNRKYYDARDQFQWSEVRRAYKDWRTYVQ